MEAEGAKRQRRLDTKHDSATGHDCLAGDAPIGYLQTCLWSVPCIGLQDGRPQESIGSSKAVAI